MTKKQILVLAQRGSNWASDVKRIALTSFLPTSTFENQSRQNLNWCWVEYELNYCLFKWVLAWVFCHFPRGVFCLQRTGWPWYKSKYLCWFWLFSTAGLVSKWTRYSLGKFSLCARAFAHPFCTICVYLFQQYVSTHQACYWFQI